MMTEPRDLSDYENEIYANVEEFGCHVTSVFDPKGNEPAFSYSAGFPVSLGQPDVIVFGLDTKLMHSMLNSLYRQCANGLVMNDGMTVEDLIDGFGCILRAVEPTHITRDFFNSAMWLHKREIGTPMSAAYQICWPSADKGIFPWDSEASEFLKHSQPAFYEPQVRIA
ncbi:DUF4262 domain-containing protein [Blastomonas fulva]|jgi:hypothetical protein|uniref:DUF4262 domain-containing protein n=1 Tax=Blastomonas fulva TaxID=1550728 RepID=UPI003D2A0E2D